MLAPLEHATRHVGDFKRVITGRFHNEDGDDSENVTHVESQMQGNFQGIELLGAAPKFRERKNCLQNIIPKVGIISGHEWKHPGRGPVSKESVLQVVSNQFDSHQFC